MIRNKVLGDELSLLGFGTMRLPKLENGEIDEALTEQMIRTAIEHGVNYFDTAVPYHGGRSEGVIGRILSAYPRESYRLADKYPGHQIAERYDPKETFERQLARCGVDYFDYYLLHNVYENDVDVYEDKKWGIIDYFKEQKRLGRIRHLGFSTHGGVEMIRGFLDRHGEDMEFCQIQFNYLDRTLQDAKAKYDLLTERNIPVWVMEPVRGGMLANLSGENENVLRALRPGESTASWAFRYLQDFPNVKMILSGMSDPAQLADNLKTFEGPAPLSCEERNALFAIADGLVDNIPCTACRYCCDGCPMELDIPTLLSFANQIRFEKSTFVAMRMDGMPPEKLPSACIGCGACAAICPQKLEIPSLLSELADSLKTIRKWSDICIERAKDASKMN